MRHGEAHRFACELRARSHEFDFQTRDRAIRPLLAEILGTGGSGDAAGVRFRLAVCGARKVPKLERGLSGLLTVSCSERSTGVGIGFVGHWRATFVPPCNLSTCAGKIFRPRSKDGVYRSTLRGSIQRSSRGYFSAGGDVGRPSEGARGCSAL